MRVLEIPSLKDLSQIMQEIKVDPYGIKIMVPKAISHLVRINSVSNITANILKQEMLSLGGDVAIARDALTGKVKKTDCLIMGNLAQFNRLSDKLNKQPFGLGKIAQEFSLTLKHYQRDNFTLNLGRYKLNLNRRTYIMGIVNLTPDSFSGDGLYKAQSSPAKQLNLRRDPASYKIAWREKLKAQSYIIEFVEKMIRDGADIIDLGGQSSRPGARSLSVKEELLRTIPVIKVLVKKIKVPISIDTHKPEVARQALDNGAVIVNDISGLRNQKMPKAIAKYKAGVVIMHMKGTPATMQKNPTYKSVIDEIIEYLNKAINIAIDAGIDKDRIIVDPGIGFGKILEHNLEILKRLKEFKVLGKPILVGPSRKSFIGKILNVEPQERLFGTLSACALAVKNGAKLVRVHDVKEVSQALKVLERIENI